MWTAKIHYIKCDLPQFPNRNLRGCNLLYAQNQSTARCCPNFTTSQVTQISSLKRRFTTSTQETSSNGGVALDAQPSKPKNFATKLWERMKQKRGEQPNKTEDKGEYKVSMRRVFALARPEWKFMSLSFLALGIGVSSNLAIPAALGAVIDAVANPASSQFTLFQIVGGLTGVLCIGTCAMFFRHTLLAIASERIVLRVRNMLFASIIHQDITFFDKRKTGDMINRVGTDVIIMARSLTSDMVGGLRAIVEGVGGVCILFYLAPKLTLLMLSVVPPVGVGAVVFGRYVRKIAKQTQEALAAATVVTEEKLSNIRTVRSFAQEAKEVELFGRKVGEVFQLAKNEAYARGSFAAGIHLAGNFSLLAVLTYGGVLSSQGAMTVGQLSSFLLYSYYGDVMRAVGASSRVFQTMDRKPKMQRDGTVKLNNFKGTIEFKDVSFAYPMRKEVEVLNKVNFLLPAGTVLAVVGPSGSGKSTIAALISRFYEPKEGSIEIDGIKISDFDYQWFRKQIGIVSQEVVLFGGTIADNIRYGNPSATMAEIEAAAKQANAHQFIMRFPNGYDTEVGQRGVALSTGQVQRIGIARAILTDPKILILDEATSALDAESERLVQEALERVMVGRSVIVIAHRLSTIIHANQILVMEDGKVAESGTFSELLAKGGIFHRLVNLQMNHKHHTDVTM